MLSNHLSGYYSQKHIYTSFSHEGKVYGKEPPVTAAFNIFSTCLTETIIFTRHKWVMKTCPHCHNITSIQLIHARFLGSQYLCHGGRGIPVVLPRKVDRKSISLSWWTGSLSGATMLGS